MVIDSYLGIGLTPVEVAKSLKVTPSRVSQIYHAVVRRAATHFGNAPRRATDRITEKFPDKTSEDFVALMQEREESLRQSQQGAWSDMVEHVLAHPGRPLEPSHDSGPDSIIEITATTRWG